MLAVGGDDFDVGIVGGNVGGIVDEPGEPSGRVGVTVGAGSRRRRSHRSRKRMRREAEVFGDKWVVVGVLDVGRLENDAKGLDPLVFAGLGGALGKADAEIAIEIGERFVAAR